ncbi:MAG: hypothetical protein J0I47_00480 [Sphingomonas sp.]|uniref:hypothetical protein n=1 Tax=Sphingomonas sp. TaxID=28214 RepID=UPI001AD60460|nr:hypothetical protein [Sphingomonas sp.]MBN8806704.1 hypothetical protein [Sphingomonas sp.]
MRKALVSIAALGAALVAVPAMAQSYGYPDANYGPQAWHHGGQGGYRPDRVSVDQVRYAVDRAIRSGRVSGREAWALRRAVDDLQRRDWRAQRDGYSWDERRDIDMRGREILQRLRYSDGYGGYGDDGYGDRGPGAPPPPPPGPPGPPPPPRGW